MSLAGTDGSSFMKNSSEIIERIVVYSLMAISLSLALPWELFPYPLSRLDFISTGAGEFFESRLFLYVGALILTYLCVLGGFLKRRLDLLGSSLDRPLALFVLVAILSIFQLTNLHASLDALFLVLSYIAFFYLVLNNFKSFRDIRLFIYALIFSGTVLSLYGIYQHVQGFKELGKYIAQMSMSVDIPSRVFAIFISPNHLAGFLIMLIPLAFVSILNTRASGKRIILLSAAVIMIDCLFLTYSRGGWISFGCVVLVLGLGYFFQKRTDALTGFVSIAALSGLTTFLITRMSSIVSPANPSYNALSASKSVTSAQGRLLLWQGALSIFKANPLRGVGMGAFSSIYPVFQYGGLYSKHAHSLYLEILAETGIFGLVFLLIVFFLILKNGLMLVRRRAGVYSEIGLALLAGSLGFMVHALIDFEWNMAAAGTLFWANAGLIFSCSRLADDYQERPTDNSGLRLKKMTVPFLISTVIASFLLFALVSSAWALYLSKQGRALYAKGHVNPALSKLEQASSLDPIDPGFKSGLAGLYFRQAVAAKSSKTKEDLVLEAIEMGRDAIRLRPHWAEYHAQVGGFYSYKKNSKLALKHFKKAELLYPNDPIYKVLTGEFFHARGDYEKAERQYKKALALQRHYAVWYPEEENQSLERAHLDLGLLYGSIGNFAQAEIELKKVLESSPENKVAKEELKRMRKGRQK